MYPRIYQDYLTDRSKAAMRAKAEQGIFPGCAPLGYKNVEVNGQKTIVLDPETAPKVRRLFELAAKKKMSLRKPAVEAEKMGLRSRNGKSFGPSACPTISFISISKNATGDLTPETVISICYSSKCFGKIQSDTP